MPLSPAVRWRSLLRQPSTIRPTRARAQFTDATGALVGAAACGFIEKLAQDGITGGCTATTFCPNDPVTRAQMAVFLVAAPAPMKP